MSNFFIVEDVFINLDNVLYIELESHNKVLLHLVGGSQLSLIGKETIAFSEEMKRIFYNIPVPSEDS